MLQFTALRKNGIISAVGADDVAGMINGMPNRFIMCTIAKRRK
jgi:hypothetical protein